MSARKTALDALIACRQQAAWSNGVLKDYIARDRLDRRDAALATRLCYGVLQNRSMLDFFLAQLLTGKVKVRLEDGQNASVAEFHRDDLNRPARIEKPAEEAKPVEKIAEKPADKPVEKAADKPVKPHQNKPNQSHPGDKPAGKTHHRPHHHRPRNKRQG